MANAKPVKKRQSRSAAKRWRQSQKARLRNRAVRSQLKGYLKRVRTSAVQHAETTTAEFRVCVCRLDQAAAKGVIHKNTASRLKSRLSAFLKKAKAAPPVAPAT